jgi:hypothetical protein
MPRYKIVINHPMYDQDELFWNEQFREDTLKLAVMKRRLCMCDELGLNRKAAYPPIRNGRYHTKEPSLIERLFGQPMFFTVEKIS